MKTTIWNKLVHDYIPDIIQARGAHAVTRTLTPAEMVPALKGKIVEEAREVLDADTRSHLAVELADLLEAVQALTAAAGLTEAEIEAIRQGRATTRGTFTRNVFLLETMETDAE